jgi:hypothetical protein
MTYASILATKTPLENITISEQTTYVQVSIDTTSYSMQTLMNSTNVSLLFDDLQALKDVHMDYFKSN